MKIVRTSLAVLPLCFAVSAAAAQDSRVSVVFANPEKYTDLKTTCVSGDADARPSGARSRAGAGRAAAICA